MGLLYSASKRTLLSGALAYQSMILSEQPVGYWRLGETSGLYADLSGNGVNLSINGGVTRGVTGLLTGNADPATSFNGTTGYLSYSTMPPQLSSVGAVSVEAWINPNSWLDFSGRAIARQDGQAQYTMLVQNGALVFNWFGSDLAWHAIQASNVLSLNAAQYVVITRDANLNVRFYVNGILVGVPTATIAPGPATGGWDIGGLSFGQWFSGVIDEVAVFNYTMTQSQITAHHNAGIAASFLQSPRLLSPSRQSIFTVVPE